MYFWSQYSEWINWVKSPIKIVSRGKRQKQQITFKRAKNSQIIQKNPKTTNNSVKLKNVKQLISCHGWQSCKHSSKKNIDLKMCDVIQVI